MNEKSAFKTAMERLRAQFYPGESVEEKVVPGQIRFDEPCVEFDSFDDAMLNEEERETMKELQAAELTIAELKQSVELNRQRVADSVRKRKEEALRVASQFFDLIDENGEIRKKKDCKTFSVSWVHKHEYDQLAELVSLTANRLKLRPNGKLAGPSECLRALLRPLMQNPGKCVLIPDDENAS